MRHSIRSRPQTGLPSADDRLLLIDGLVAVGNAVAPKLLVDLGPGDAVATCQIRGRLTPAPATPPTTSTTAATTTTTASQCRSRCNGNNHGCEKEEKEHFVIVVVHHEQSRSIAANPSRLSANFVVVVVVVFAANGRDRIDVHVVRTEVHGQGGIQCSHQGASQGEVEQQKGKANDGKNKKQVNGGRKGLVQCCSSADIVRNKRTEEAKRSTAATTAK